MKILAIEKDLPGVSESRFTDEILKAESARAWQLHQSGVIRELYFRADRNAAVLILECEGVDEARATLSSLPLVKGELIDFDVIPLVAYPGFARLFQDQ
jgi:muconolactone delta-isomerase